MNTYAHLFIFPLMTRICADISRLRPCAALAAQFSSSPQSHPTPFSVFSVTSVFKIRIRAHPRNPRGKALPADALATKEPRKDFFIIHVLLCG
jgi:hypothetical protein